MWKRCQLLVVLLQCLLTNCRLVPSARPKGVPRLKIHLPTVPTLLPHTTTEISIREVGNFFDPFNNANSEFCAAVATEPIDYPITPWWYRYCIEMLQNKKGKMKEQVNVATIKQFMKDEMEAYNKLDKMESRKQMNSKFNNKNNINNRRDKFNYGNNKF